MHKETVILAVSIVTLMVAGFAAYSVYGIDDLKSQSEVIEIKDYSKDFESIQIAIAQVNQKLETFESETVNELEEIKIELEDKVEQQPQPIILPFEITTNKQVFLQNDSVEISVDNVSPQSSIKIDLLSPSNEVITTRNVFSDSAGSLHTIFQLPSFISEGDYTVQVTSNKNVDTSFITIIEQDATNSESSQSDTSQTTQNIQSGLTLILDKEEYSLGDIIRVTGIGPANSSVDLKLVDPNDKITTSHSSTEEDGTYTIIYIIPSDAETGNWEMNLTVGNEESETIVKIIN